MKNNNMEILAEFLAHTPAPQSNYEKRNLLYPISKQFDFKVDFKRIIFPAENLEGDPTTYEIPFRKIYRIYHNSESIYVLCMDGLLISFDIKRNEFCFVSLLEGVSVMEIGIWWFRRWIKTKWNSLFHIGSGLHLI